MTQFVSRFPAGGAGWTKFLPRELAGLVVDLFTYQVNFLPVPASNSLQVDLQIQNDSNFVILGGFGVVTETDNTTFLTYPAWPFTVLINDTGAGRLLMNQAVPLGSLFVPANFVAPWVQPKFVRAGSTVSTTVANLSATGRNVRLSFVGAKIFGF